MKILSIDQSLVQSGYCIFQDDKLIEKGVIESGQKGTKRLFEIKQEIQVLLKNHRPEYVVFEDYSYGSRGRATFSLGELGGMLKLMFFEAIELWYTVPIPLWKKYLTGKGNCKKDVVMMKVFKKFGFETANNNVADAYVMGRFLGDYLTWERGKDNFTKGQITSFEKYQKYKKEKTLKGTW